MTKKLSTRCEFELSQYGQSAKKSSHSSKIKYEMCCKLFVYYKWINIVISMQCVS